MGSIGDDFTTDVPAVGAAGDQYAQDVDDILDEVIARLSTPVPVGSIAAAQSGETLDMNAQGVVNAGYLQLYDLAATPAGPPYNVWAAYNGDVYWVGAAGVIQLTAGGNINVAGVGAIVGDYGGSNPAAVAFVDATETYEFYDSFSAAQWAIVKARQLDLVDEASGRVVHVKPSAAIAATYTAQFPVDDPAAGVSLMTMDLNGLMDFADTTAVTNGPLFNSDVTLQSASKIIHGSRYIQMDGSVGVIEGGTGTFTSSTCTSTSVNLDVFYRVPLQRGQRVKTVQVHMKRTGAGTATLQLRHSVWSGSSPAVTADTDTLITTGNVSLTVTVASAHKLAAVETFAVRVIIPNSGDVIKMITVEYDNPA